MIDTTVYRVLTYHRTHMLMSSARRLIHRHWDNIWRDQYPIYAQLLDDGVSLFAIKDNRFVYISSVSDTHTHKGAAS